MPVPELALKLPCEIVHGPVAAYDNCAPDAVEDVNVSLVPLATV